jgi:hypothetical protein
VFARRLFIPGRMDGFLHEHRYGNEHRCLYEPMENVTIIKGQGGHKFTPPIFMNDLTTERIRIDCVSIANHNLIRLLDEPGNKQNFDYEKYFLNGVLTRSAT